MTAQTLFKTKLYQNKLIGEDSSSLINLTLEYFQDFLHWWYISMPVWYILSLRRILTVINDQYSITLLLSNFFIPWHRDFTFVGFFIGIVMKLLFLPIGISVFLAVLAIYLLFIIIWLLLPIIIILGIFISPFNTLFL